VLFAIVAAAAATFLLLPRGEDQPQEQPSPHAIEQGD
jgi:hypothetical protein